MQSIERSLGVAVSMFASFTCFIVMDLTNEGAKLTTAKIFSTAELMGTLKLIVLFMGISLGFYF